MKPPTGFDIFNYWTSIHSKVIGKPIPGLANMTPQAKVYFNSYIYRTKQAFNFNHEDLKALVLFSYTHNPLNLTELSGYGNVNKLCSSASSYNAWAKNNTKGIENKGKLYTVLATSPSLEGTDTDLQSYLNEMIETTKQTVNGLPK